ncbi:MAG TPA: YIP1 family protein [Acidimicrobiia bacterium]|nr:YIP1 family protein [Acidimicrobiia bacterium]
MRALRRALRASIFDRRAHSELFFDSDATADAVLLVAGIQAVVYLGRVGRFGFSALSLTGLLETIIYGVIAWLILAATTWFVSTRLFQGSGQLQTTMRLHGHCELPLVLAVFGSTAALVGLAWSLAAKVVATSEGSSIDLLKAVAAVLLGLALLVLVRLIFRLPFLALGALF